MYRFVLTIGDFFHHLFIPRESNNHRAKILHHQSILVVIALLLSLQLTFSLVRQQFPQVLGVSSSISAGELLSLTNLKRQEQGLSTLVFNDQLNVAAALKASDMFAKGYWAHNAPDGTTPWYFIKKAGYSYTFAGENLARGFDKSMDVIAAWIASPSHRENMYSKNYTDIGFAIADGKLLGEQTTLVVEMFGSKALPTVARQSSPPVVRSNTAPSRPQPLRQPAFVPSQSLGAYTIAKPLVDSSTLAQRIAVFLLGLFLTVLLVDMIVIERRKIVRLVGHNVDHIVFLSMILIMIIVMGRGLIL